MKFVILAAIVAVAFGAAGDKCKIDVPTLDLAADNIALKGWKATPAAAQATCTVSGTTGTFKKAVAGAANDEASLKAALTALTGSDVPASGGTPVAGILAIIECKAGYSGAITYTCLTTGRITFTGCAAVKCATKNAAAGSGATAYVAFGDDNSALGTVATGVCTSPKNSGTLTATCSAANTWTVANGCNADAKWTGKCPIPTCGDAKTTSVATCDATAGQAEANCGTAATKTAATFDCIADATPAPCTAKQCDEKDAWAAGAMTEAGCTAKAAASKKVDVGASFGDYKCTLSCGAKKRGGINKAARTCLLVADTSASWVKQTASAPGTSGNASALSLFAAFAVVAAYLA